MLPRLASPCKRLTNGVCLARPCKTESANFSPCCASCKFAHLPATSVSNAIASSCSGLRTSRDAAPSALTRMLLNHTRVTVKDAHGVCRGFNHISIFNKEILNPSKSSIRRSAAFHPAIICHDLMPKIQSRREGPRKNERPGSPSSVSSLIILCFED